MMINMYVSTFGRFVPFILVFSESLARSLSLSLSPSSDSDWLTREFSGASDAC